jgi:hypothetical protein
LSADEVPVPDLAVPDGFGRLSAKQLAFPIETAVEILVDEQRSGKVYWHLRRLFEMLSRATG